VPSEGAGLAGHGLATVASVWRTLSPINLVIGVSLFRRARDIQPAAVPSTAPFGSGIGFAIRRNRT
jgi:hypothetical protein